MTVKDVHKLARSIPDKTFIFLTTLVAACGTDSSLLVCNRMPYIFLRYSWALGGFSDTLSRKPEQSHTHF